MNLWAGPGATSAPANSARLQSYRLDTTDAVLFAAARSRLTEDPATGTLTGTDPAGATLTLGLHTAATH